MTGRILRGLAVLALASLPFEAVAQETMVWSVIACVHSKISVPPGLHCRTTQNYAGGHFGWAAGPGGEFRRWSATGDIGGVKYFYHLNEATSLGASIGAGGSLEEVIKADLERGKETRDYSALSNRGGVDFLTFTGATGDACVGIRRYGPSMGAGFQWILAGVRCEPRGRPITDAEIDRFIAGATYRGT